MSVSETSLLEPFLDAWRRHNQITLNLLGLVADGGLEARATSSSPTVGQLFAHMHHERLISVSEEAPEAARPVPEHEWPAVSDRDQLASMLADSATVVSDAVRGRVVTQRQLDRSYDHPILLMQLLLWHEAYHHGQIKLALKVAGLPISDDDAGPATWDVWRRRIADAR